ncbi:tyrosine--tRNA ligase [Actinomycetaceae bacterium MB13-C1-2]|nr:tyrosine--tRNA ligase [Actinomycetaceae bacterium MB13-C1-2]
MSDLIAELEWRGLLKQHTDMEQLKTAFDSGPVTFYCGFDPTAPSLHHGHLVQLVLMKHLQRAGHHPLALVGGATGQIGDPREVGERAMQAKETVAEWTERLRRQIEKFLDFDGDNPARMVNNLDWTADMTAIGLLRDIGKYFRLGTMISKDVVARRLESEEGISYTEFSYQVLQSNDYLELFRRYGCTLQTGGNDQWGNLISGVELIRKADGAAVHVMTTPIITKADGTKFGKSEGGAIWLDPSMMSPYDFYQFWLQTADEDVVKMLKIFTFLTREEIGELEVATIERPHAREAQKALAAEVTRLVHGQGELEQVLQATEALWGKGDLAGLDADTLTAATAHLDRADVVLGETTVVDALLATGLEKGRQAALRLAKQGGVAVNNDKALDPDAVFTAEQVLPGGVILIRKGRKNLAALTVLGD